MKRKVFASAVVVICLSFLISGTMAFFTAEERAHNVITTGGIKIDLLEWADEAKTVPFPSDGVHGVMPGTEITKIVEVKNTGSSEAWIRILVDKSITLSEGTEGDADPGLLVLDLDDTNWTEGTDGCYYYRKPLAAGEVTTPLFASVTLDETMGNLYQNSTATVDVTAYAVQAANNGSSALEAKGWAAADTGVDGK